MEQEVALNLKHLCRETIRKHLLQLDPHENLFHRVPRLGLPALLQRYLLYNQTLDDDDQDQDNDYDDDYDGEEDKEEFNDDSKNNLEGNLGGDDYYGDDQADDY